MLYHGLRSLRGDELAPGRTPNLCRVDGVVPGLSVPWNGMAPATPHGTVRPWWRT